MNTADRVVAAFEKVHREDFLLLDQREFASQNRPLPIGHGQTNSQPTTVEHMLTRLDVRPGDRVLDVGSGSGWTSALLGELTGPKGSVYGVELVTELAAWGRDNVAKYPMPWVSVLPVEPNVLGLPTQAPFDRILVSADGGELPDELVDQLDDGGRMVLPVAGRMLVVEKHGNKVEVNRFGHYAFVPLR